ncbi:fucosyltransferase 6 S homeolog [Xenopus laevis]|uniref:Fucosyltransferase n=2 Tax=Xenopus laevis TaxID=8355 RepID=Q7SZU7_XENLA|nr:fucosyltransferase 6 S homeolog [Xenopus laevis]AAQ96639.1 alpha 1,3/4 fucosyltransferase Lewis 1 [Xenopus laevis]OCT81739.1 hypothetical protein XELAEV_18024247mg [Xenopus laevis]CAE30462.1 GDP-fucose alpha3-fucosyltransferase [Xenopus laevis]
MEHKTRTLSFRNCLLFFTFQVVVAFFLFSALFQVKHGNDQTEPIDVTSKPEEPAKIILLWTWPFGYTFPLNKCPSQFDGTGCFFTANRSLYSEAAAVVLHSRDVCSSRNQLPQAPRPPKQYWVWFTLESPSHNPNTAFMEKLINLTMSYRADSDIFTPYGWLERHDGKENFTMPAKTKLVAWVVSNWNPNSRRIKYYEELKPHLAVDIYGLQHLPLPRPKHIEILSQYKFYLAFENSIHEDYITEKLWHNALSSWALPVVLGPSRSNYERFLPPESFIHVDDFPTAKGLADYLNELDKDDNKYMQHFNWRKHLKPVAPESWNPHYCKVCKAIKDAPSYRTFPSITNWFK